MGSEQRQRIRAWLEGLGRDKLVEVAAECVEELILAETVHFYTNNTAPYWDATGDRLDGSERDGE